MRLIKSIAAMAFSALLLSSCASLEKTSPVFGIGGNNINTYVAADLDLANAKKVEATVEKKTILWFIPIVFNGDQKIVTSNRYGHLSSTQSQALYRAKENSQADIILEPQFTTEKHSWFFGIYRTYKTTVTGWGVRVKGLKQDNNLNYQTAHKAVIGY